MGQPHSVIDGHDYRHFSQTTSPGSSRRPDRRPGEGSPRRHPTANAPGAAGHSSQLPERGAARRTDAAARQLSVLVPMLDPRVAPGHQGLVPVVVANQVRGAPSLPQMSETTPYALHPDNLPRSGGGTYRCSHRSPVSVFHYRCGREIRSSGRPSRACEWGTEQRSLRRDEHPKAASFVRPRPTTRSFKM